MDEKDMVKMTELLVQAGYSVHSITKEHTEEWQSGEVKPTGAVIVKIRKGVKSE